MCYRIFFILFFDLENIFLFCIYIYIHIELGISSLLKESQKEYIIEDLFVVCK